MRLIITEAYFTQRVGREPIQDDLERANCPHAGQIGHYFCGWNKTLNWPNFVSKADLPELRNAWANT
jgi:hypothetical protein